MDFDLWNLKFYLFCLQNGYTHVKFNNIAGKIRVFYFSKLYVIPNRVDVLENVFELSSVRVIKCSSYRVIECFSYRVFSSGDFIIFITNNKPELSWKTRIFVISPRSSGNKIFIATVDRDLKRFLSWQHRGMIPESPFLPVRDKRGKTFLCFLSFLEKSYLKGREYVCNFNYSRLLSLNVLPP